MDKIKETKISPTLNIDKILHMYFVQKTPLYQIAKKYHRKIKIIYELIYQEINKPEFSAEYRLPNYNKQLIVEPPIYLGHKNEPYYDNEDDITNRPLIGTVSIEYIIRANKLLKNE